jgi:hypothetical protein
MIKQTFKKWHYVSNGSDSHPFTADMKTPFGKCARTAVIGQDITRMKNARVTITNVRIISL